MSDIARTAPLLAEVFPGTDVAGEDYLTWLYERSPFGEVIERNLDDEIGRAGHYALVPILLAIDGVDHRAALSLNTAVHVRAQGGGTFVRLASETIAAAAGTGIEAVVGVANANSTPGFLRRLDFHLLCSLPAHIMIPTPGPRDDVLSSAVEATTLSAGAIAGDAERLLQPPQTGAGRRWTPETLRWRLSRPNAQYAIHRGPEVLAVSCVDHRQRIPVAVLLKVFAAAPLTSRARRSLVRAVCRHHRAPLALHVGLNDLAHFRGVPLPERLRPSPLNLIYRSLAHPPRVPVVSSFELLDFDAY